MTDWKEAARWYRARFRLSMETIGHRTRLAAAEHENRARLVNTMADILMDIAYDEDDPNQDFCNVCHRSLIEEDGHQSGCLYVTALAVLAEGARRGVREMAITADFEVVPDLVCGRTYRDQRSEDRLPSMREGEVSSYVGCGNPMTYMEAYRCRQCARWFHGSCLDRHFEE